MEQESRLLIEALRRSVAGREAPVSDNVDWGRFYLLTRIHSVTALVWEGIQNDPVVQERMPAELKKRFSTEYLQTVYRDSQLEHTKDKLHEGLCSAGVDHVFLKGARIKYDYPIPALRTMSDMDILVKTSDYDTVTKVAGSIGGKAYYGDGNHHNFHFPGNVAVEFHPNLVHPGALLCTELNPGWQYATKNEKTGAYELTPEGLYLHTMGHLAGHFATAGVGVRFVLDIWVLRNRSKQPDREFVEKELARMNLLDFAQKIEALAEVWFAEGERTELLDEMAQYIISSGSHGRDKRAMLNAVSLSKSGSRSSALLHKIFYPRRELETRYPWAEGRAWLLPAAWFARAWGAVTKRGHLIRKWSKGTGEVSQEQVSAQREKMARFGIKRKQ